MMMGTDDSRHGAVGFHRLGVRLSLCLPLVLDVDGAEAAGEAPGHAGARHGRERGAAEHEVGAVGPGAVRDHHPGARRGAQLPVLAPHLRAGRGRR